jgi:Zn-dependent protease with chaperone function
VDFFREQDVARRNTRLLTLLFMMAVVTLIILTNLLFLGLLWAESDSYSPSDIIRVLDWPLFFAVGGVISLVIGVVVLVNWLNFSRGGSQVAAALGGTLVQPGTDKPLERRALNIVQELALAANMPVPSLFLLEHESGVNAFAAGTHHTNAVVAITRGALEALNRDELQGVVGHEFSHILNGDMRLSIRLAAMLRGITFIGDLGSILLRISSHRHHFQSRKKDDGKAAMLALGLGLYLIGLLGGLMAGLIKSAISKQKEYLADASSVQFTRNPDGIGNALKIIGGYANGTFVESARAEEMSHLFFGQVRHRLWSGFATHPPIEQRIRRIDPRWDGKFLPANVDPGEMSSETENHADQNEMALRAGIAAFASADVTTALPRNTSSTAEIVPPATNAALLNETTDPLGAMALLLGMLWNPQHEELQWQAIEVAGIKGLDDLVRRWCEPLRTQTPSENLIIIERSIPALRGLSPEQYRVFRNLLETWIDADGKTVLQEWCLFQLVCHYLDPELINSHAPRLRHKTLNAVSKDLAITLGALAHLSEEDTERAFLRGAEILGLTMTLPEADAIVMTAFTQSVDELAACYPLLKVTILKAMASVAADDGKISGSELTLIKAIAAVMDCPAPDNLLAAHGIGDGSLAEDLVDPPGSNDLK